MDCDNDSSWTPKPKSNNKKRNQNQNKKTSTKKTALDVNLGNYNPNMVRKFSGKRKCSEESIIKARISRINRKQSIDQIMDKCMEQYRKNKKLAVQILKIKKMEDDIKAARTLDDKKMLAKCMNALKKFYNKNKSE